jgi:hypothetical protein
VSSFVSACAASPAPVSRTVEAASVASEPPVAVDGVAASDSSGAAAPAVGPQGLPTACARSEGGYCLPPKAFVETLCSRSFPGAALAMFRGGSPWTRGYLTRNVEAWNASGGASSTDTLAFDEEVIVLVHRAPAAGAMVVSGASGGFDVLRWDGSCATLDASELTTRQPPRAKSAKVRWKSLDDAIQGALRGDEKIGSLDAQRRKECKGVTMGEVSAKCEKADKALGAAVVAYVRRGGDLPAPARMP